MTDQRTELRSGEDGYDADGYSDSEYIESDGGDLLPDDWDVPGEWDLPDEWDALDDDEWDAYVAPRPAAPERPSPRWYRDPRWLFGLIALAAAALVVATVLLVTGRGSGEIPTAPELTTRTPASTTSTPSPSSTSPRESTSSPSTTPTSASSTSEEPGAFDAPPPVEPTAEVAEASPEPPAPTQSRSPAGPRINVTRTPMSFSPGKN